MSFISFGRVVLRLKFRMNHTCVEREFIAYSYLSVGRSVECVTRVYVECTHTNTKLIKHTISPFAGVCVCVSLVKIHLYDESVCSIFIDLFIRQDTCFVIHQNKTDITTENSI